MPCWPWPALPAPRAWVWSAPWGADAHSAIFYSRVKGEAEEALLHLAFPTLVVVRPSVLAGEREALGQAPRAGEKIAISLNRLFGGLIPANYQAISAHSVAHTLVEEVASRQGHHGSCRARCSSTRRASRPCPKGPCSGP